MNFYIDFEATQPEQEIISVGVVSERGDSFQAYVKPQFSKVSQFVTQLTGITQDMLNQAEDLNLVFYDLYDWCHKQESFITKWNFFSYGDADIDFLKHSLQNIKGEKQLIISSIMIAKMKDYSKNVKKFFQGSVSLIKAFNFLKAIDSTQNHNALEDAKMLAEVFKKVESADKPLQSYPFHIGNNATSQCYQFPIGKFYCKGIGKNATEREFVDIHNAITWLINNKMSADVRENVHRDRVAKKIMKAIRQKNTYMEYTWRRVKKEG